MSGRISQTITLGSRGSELARAQTAMVAKALQLAWPAIEVRIEIVQTRGDERSLEAAEPIDPRAGRKGLFTGEIERFLAAGNIDIAVHSAKDLPSDRTPGLELRGALPRAAVEDVLVRKNSGGLATLEPNAVVATGSVRRQHQLRWKCPELRIVDLRGNVPTRLRKLVTNDWEAIVLARAGVERLGNDLSSGSFAFEGASLHAEILSREEFLPAGGQGVIALQVRSGDDEARKLVDRVNHLETFLCLQAEREFLRLLQGDCDSPVGVLAVIQATTMKLSAQVFEDGRLAPRVGAVEGAANGGGERLAAELMERINGA
ncbi:MAG TPA: hydroxymethylbilane synthase [Chthoniobacterales bacterium]|nr:hydroxymethylbilane synthase [Chthoniobacterales bacterium]